MACAAPCILDTWLAQHCGAGRADLAQRLREEQRARLAAQLEHARRHSRFYRERLKNLPGGQISWSDLAALPLTTARDLRHWEDFLCVSRDAVERMVTLQTSGTSGPPKRLAFSRADLAATRDFFQAGMAQLLKARDRALVLWPGANRPHGVSALLREALGAQGITVLAGDPLTSRDSLRREIAEHNPHVIIAAPRQLAPLAELLAGERPPGMRPLALRGLLSSAEILPPDLARTLRQRHGLLLLEHYGLTETGYGCGVECPAHNGYHLRELHILVEIVDPQSDAVLPDGEEGEVVITTLCHEAMPLIRYRTGDVARMLPGPCRCGSPLRRLSAIKGRLVRRGAAWHTEQTPKGLFCERTADASL